MATRALNHKSSTRAAVWNAQDGCCYHCGKQLHPFTDFHVDHLVRLCEGGADTLENMVASCVACNLRRAGPPKKDKPLKIPGELCGEEPGGDLCRRRVGLGLSQRDLAVTFGVRQQTISEWETGVRRIRLAGIVDLALQALERGPCLACWPQGLVGLEEADDDEPGCDNASV